MQALMQFNYARLPAQFAGITVTPRFCLLVDALQIA
jgi:hypothetical protein